MRLAGAADAARCAGEDRVPGAQGHTVAEFGDDPGEGEGHLAAGRVLQQPAVGLAPHPQADEVVDLVGRRQPGPERHGRVDALALEPLAAVRPLEIALGDVVGDEKAEDVVHGLRFGDRASVAADDQRDLGLVVPLGEEVGVVGDVVGRADDRVGALGEEGGMLGPPVRELSLAPALRLLEVVPVVPAGAQDVAVEAVQRGFQADLGRRHGPAGCRRTGRFEGFLAAADDVVGGAGLRRQHHDRLLGSVHDAGAPGAVDGQGREFHVAPFALSGSGPADDRARIDCMTAVKSTRHTFLALSQCGGGAVRGGGRGGVGTRAGCRRLLRCRTHARVRRPTAARAGSRRPVDTRSYTCRRERNG